MPTPEVMLWRTVNREEVDFVLEWRGRLLAVEVKSSRHPTLPDAKDVAMFLDLYGDAPIGGLILHGGDETYPLGERVLAAPLSRVL